MKEKPPRRPRTVRTPESGTLVHISLQRSLRRLAGKHAQIFGMSYWSVGRMLKAMNFHPYKILTTQESKPTDSARQIRFSEKMESMLDNKEIEHKFSMISDEAHF